MSPSLDFILLLLSGILRFGCTPDHKKIERPGQLAEIAEDSSWDVVAGIWPDCHDAAAMAALLIGGPGGDLRLVKYKNYGGPTLVVATRRAYPALDAHSDRLAVTLDQILKEFHEKAKVHGSEPPPHAVPAQSPRPERVAVPQSNQALAHDLNNLLTVILCCGEVLADKIEGDESGASYLRDLLTATVRAERLAARFLDPGVPDVLDVAAVLAESRGMLRTMGGSKLAVTISMTPDPVQVLIDKRGFESIVCDIVLHARLAMPAGGWVRVGVSPAEIRPDSALPLQPGSYAKITFDYSPQVATSMPPLNSLPTTRETVLETGLSRAFLQVESASGRMFIHRDSGQVTNVTIYLVLAGLRHS